MQNKNLEKYKNKKATNNEIDDQKVLADAKNKYMKTEFFEKVNKYIQYDDLIKKEMLKFRKEVNTLKEEKKDLETYLLKYLEVQKGDTINVGDEKILKVETQKKAPLNKEIMKSVIIDDMKKEGFIRNEREGEIIIQRMFDSMEKNRPITNVVKLQRKKPKGKKQKANDDK